MMEAIQGFTQTILSMQWSDYLDIIVVAFIIYKLLPLLRTPHIMRLARTVVLLVLVAWATDVMHLYTLNWLLSQLLAIGLLAFVVLFQPELRQIPPAPAARGRRAPPASWAGLAEKRLEQAQSVSEEGFFEPSSARPAARRLFPGGHLRQRQLTLLPRTILLSHFSTALPAGPAGRGWLPASGPARGCTA